MTFGEIVANRRREVGLSQTDVAKALDVSVGTINKIEHNRIKSSSKTAKKLAELLQLNGQADTVYLSGDRDIDLKMLEKRVTSAIYELELILDILRSMKGEPNEQNI